MTDQAKSTPEIVGRAINLGQSPPVYRILKTDIDTLEWCYATMSHWAKLLDCDVREVPGKLKWFADHAAGWSGSSCGSEYRDFLIDDFDEIQAALAAGGEEDGNATK